MKCPGKTASMRRREKRGSDAEDPACECPRPDDGERAENGWHERGDARDGGRIGISSVEKDDRG